MDPMRHVADRARRLVLAAAREAAAGPGAARGARVDGGGVRPTGLGRLDPLLLGYDPDPLLLLLLLCPRRLPRPLLRLLRPRLLRT